MIRERVRRLLSVSFGIVVALGIIIRVLCLFWTVTQGLNADVYRYKDWATIAYTKGFAATYDKKNITFGQSPNNMPPGSIYSVSGAYQLSLLTNRVILKTTSLKEGTSQILNDWVPLISLKLPSFFADIIMVLLIYLILKKYTSEQKAILGSALFFLNPVIIYNSVVWGQMDAVNAAFVVAALFFLTRKQYFLSILAAFFSLFIKLTFLPLLPFYLLFMWRIIGMKRTILHSLISVLILLLLTFPITSNPIIWTVWLVTTTSNGEEGIITAGAYNFWWFIFGLTSKSMPDSKTSFILSLSTIGYLLFGIISLPFIKKIWKLRSDVKPFLFFFILSVLWFAAFLFLPRMHERYFYFFFPLAAIALPLINKYIRLLIVISVIHFLNLYFVWNPHPIGLLELFHTQIVAWVLSGLLSGCFFYLLIKTFRLSIKNS